MQDTKYNMQYTIYNMQYAVGSLKLYVSSAEYSLFYRSLLQKRPIILRSSLTDAQYAIYNMQYTICNTQYTRRHATRDIK